MKTLLTSTAIALALMSAPAIAATHVGYTYGDGRAATEPMFGENAFTVDRDYAVEGYELFDGELTADDLDDAQVYSTISGDMIGGVDDVLIENGEISAYVMEIGGFLGLGDTEVTVAADQVMLMRNPGLGDTRVYINATEEQLESYPRYEYEAAGMGEPIVEGDNAMMANDTPVVVGDTMATDTMAADTMATDDTTVVVVDNTAADTQMATTEGTYMRRDGTAVGAPVFGDDFVADPNYTVDGYEPYTGGYDNMLDEGDVEEAKLFSSVTGEEIGEVEDALTENGVLSALVLDIGGFLGLGEHTITVRPDQVSYVRDPGLLSNVRVYINATEEQLKAYPSYNADL